MTTTKTANAARQNETGQPENRQVSPNAQTDEQEHETRLRPAQLANFVGQAQVKENLSIAIAAARIREEPLDHVVIYGPPGLGKTTLANIIAHEMHATIKTTSGPAIERPSDVAAILTGLQPNDVLFIDEIHRLNHAVEEVLYSAMEDFFLSWVVGKGLSARNINLRINPFTLVGATTRYSMVSAPLRDRFGSVLRLDYYSDHDMATVVSRSARILEIDADDEGRREVAIRSRGTPRIGNRLLRRARDYALVRAANRVTGPVASKALDSLGVDARGLDETDHRLLNNIIEKFNGGPVGLDTLATSLGEDTSTVMEVLEPFLIQQGFLERTPRGRVATRLAYQYVGAPSKPGTEKPQQQRLLPDR
ncbi:MAG: Holliday junction branch migration DNA helicase RuvB [Chloroflexota bacterium]|nr:Holliday junction branch migration DNA helicase RuvB [Chloroflexota bacterium]MDE2958591.1 Holliday junction branch migration DNA helicase RuvB [Chloroflexota bacterium]